MVSEVEKVVTVFPPAQVIVERRFSALNGLDVT